jgi:hypothetical protein
MISITRLMHIMDELEAAENIPGALVGVSWTELQMLSCYYRAKLFEYIEST